MSESLQKALDDFVVNTRTSSHSKVDIILEGLDERDAEGLRQILLAKNPSGRGYLYGSRKLSEFISKNIEPVSDHTVNRWRKKQGETHKTDPAFSKSLGRIPMPTVRAS